MLEARAFEPGFLRRLDGLVLGQRLVARPSRPRFAALGAGTEITWHLRTVAHVVERERLALLSDGAL